jgi:AraC-like DNA-binding protein
MRTPSGASPSTPTSRVLCDTELLRIGTFAVHPADPRFAHAGEYYGHEIVFPRSSVWIHRPGRPALLADPTVVNFYNHGDPYSRSKASERGDLCDWFAVDTAALLEVLGAIDPGAARRPDRPFAFTHGPSDATSYRLQRLAAAHAAGPSPDGLLLDELVLRVVARVLRAAHEARSPAAPAAPAKTRARELAHRVQLVLADRYPEPLGLAALAREVASSPFHLCRAFKAARGIGLARYRIELRLRHSLERVAEPDADLSRVALDVGFATHSHFTAAFRSTFGETPSAFRQAANRQRLGAARARLRVV